MALDEELGRLNIKVSMDDSELAKSVDNVDRSISKNAKSFSAFNRSIRGGDQEIASHAAKLGMLKESIVGMSDKTEKLNAVISNQGKMSQYTAAEQETLRGKYAQSQVQLEAYKNEFTNTAKEMADLQVKTQGFTGKLNTFGSAATNVGDKMTRNVTVPLGIVGGLALKTGMDFEAGMSRVQAIAGASKSQLKQLTDQAIELGQKTQFSASEVSGGMENLASAGFSVNEIMQAMPGMLDLAAVSGGDVAQASEYAASALRAFNLDASQSGHVSDVFAKAAADTNAEVGDMGEAMKYAGPVASQLGMSIEETAAAIGDMSDKGIKGSQAGTTLRGALTRLAKPTQEMTSTMQQYGLSFFDAQGKMLPFGQIIGQLHDKVGNLDEKSRAAALTTLFGKEALSGMMALVSSGEGKYDNLTKSLQNSDGAADKMAKTMQDNAKNAIEQMMGSLETAAIKIEQAAAPSIKQLAEFVGKLADAFSNLSPEAQNMILKFGLLTAAAGPALSIIGRVSTGTVAMTAAFAKVKTGMAVTKELGALTTGATGATRGMELLGGGAGKAALAFGALSPVMLGVIGTAALLGGGLVLLGKAYADHQYATRWGDDVSASASTALDGMQKAQQGISDALITTGNDGENASKKVGDAFENMADRVKKSADDSNAALSKSYSNLPPEVQAMVEASIKQRQKENNDRVQEAKTTADAVANIEKQGGKLSVDQQTFVSNSRQKLNELGIQNLGLSAKAEKQALAALNNDVENMNAQARDKAQTSLTSTLEKADKSYEKSKASIKSMYDQGVIGAEDFSKANAELDKTHSAQINPMLARLYELMKASGTSSEMMETAFETMGYSLDDAKSAFDNMAKGADKSTGTVISATGKMSDKTKEAVKQWNGLVFDEKTGQVKTNAKDEVAEAMKSGDNWNSLKLAAKEAPVHSDARAVFAEAAIQAGTWDKLSIKDKEAMVKSNAAEEVLKGKASLSDFNSLDVPTKQLIVSSNAPQQVFDSLTQMGTWDSLPDSIKNIYLNSNVTGIVDGSKMKLSEWNTLTPEQKQLISQDSSSAAVKSAITTTDQWNALPTPVKEILAHNSDARKAFSDAKIDLGEYEKVKPTKKKLDADSSKAKSESDKAKNSVNQFSDIKTKTKSLDAKWQGGQAVRNAKSDIDSIHDKTVTITTKEVTEKAHKATGDPNFAGGDVVVNDQKGSLYKELIQLPSGRTFMPQGRNREYNLPQGTRIFNATDTARLMTAKLNTDRLKTLSQLDIPSPTAGNVPVPQTQGTDDRAIAMMATMVDFLSTIAEKDFKPYIGKDAIVDAANSGLGDIAAWRRNGVSV
ncbi:phage tail tape measure protein [Weissella muntiaci]|uniref:Phage tail tape measure protein n=1 Tax=Weissella muntiaci TaxID=2508881 RepID=A0A6C2CCJ4_9LACO|nr:phage tail tape measure protein [Weissella muntiaci]TYC50895.1 phage tail tape measure protein [Weissella muntiaci]